METQYLSGRRTRDLVVFFGLAFGFSWAIGIPLALSKQGVIPPICISKGNLPFLERIATGP
ncbi:MAG: hypothetical protein ACE5G8_00550 [Anaerolineae bacterium]